MIYYKQGDIIQGFIKGEVRVIAHQANCFNTMGSGVAKAIKDKFPEAYEADCSTVKGDYNKLGGTSTCVNNHGMIFNLYGQYNYGREEGVVYTDYEALAASMRSMQQLLDYIEYEGKIGFPKIGCGTAGGDWMIVETMINDIFKHYPVIVYSL